MTKLTETQSLILSAGVQRADNLAMPLPKGLHGAAAKKVVTMMIGRGWLEEVDANIRKGEQFWRETGDCHGTTLVVTDEGLLAIGIEPVIGKTLAAIREHAKAAPDVKTPRPRSSTKQALLIEMLRAPEGATMEAIMFATGWQAHTARGAMSGALGKKLGLLVTSAKEKGGARIYRIGRRR